MKLLTLASLLLSAYLLSTSCCCGAPLANGSSPGGATSPGASGVAPSLAARLAAAADASVTCVPLEPADDVPALVCALVNDTRRTTSVATRAPAAPAPSGLRVSVFTVFFRTDDELVRPPLAPLRCVCVADCAARARRHETSGRLQLSWLT